MNIDIKDNKIIITPDEGKVLTNGDTYGVEAELPLNANVNEWWDITREEYEIILEQNKPLVE